MAATFWKKMRGSSATRLFSAYLALVLAVAMAGPGLSVYASEGELLAEESVVVPAEVEPEDEPVELVSEPVSEALPVDPIPEEEASSESAVTVSAESVMPVAPVVALAAPVVALGTPVLSGDANPPLTSGGVRIEDPSSGTYTLATVDEAKPAYPADFSIALTTYETSAGWFVDFVSNYPISRVVVKGGTGGANLYSYSPAVYSDTGLHAPANPNGKWAGLSHLDFYFGTIVEEPETGDLLVHKFLDSNGNGEYEPLLGESLLEGWEFTLSADETELDSGMTDEDGMLRFADLEAGTYSVTETLIEGWTNTTPLTQEAEVVSGETTHLYFGNKPRTQEPVLGDLLVHKFLDSNGNGEYEPLLGESLLEGWEFTLSADETELDSGMTDEDGMLRFADLEAGTYSVTETLIEGWTNTTPLTQEAEVVSGETTHLYFGNVEESLPFTELDLAITKLADKHSAKPGELISYTLTYRNLGDLAAENYTIVDDYDERYVSIVNANGGTVSGGKITWTFAGPLTKEAGAQTLTYTVRVISGMPVGTTSIDNVVVISHPLDENPANNRDDERVVVVVTAPVTPAEPFLPFTGAEYTLLTAVALAAGIGGIVLRMKGQMS